jgi:hypothetical protein
MYKPIVGDRVLAKRTWEAPSMVNNVVGPVTQVGLYGCRIQTNIGTEIEGAFWVRYAEWDISYLGKGD